MPSKGLRCNRYLCSGRYAAEPVADRDDMRSENGATLLQSDVLQVRRHNWGSDLCCRLSLQVLHRIIGHNRAPELVSEASLSCICFCPNPEQVGQAFTLLYRLCDAPAPAVVPPALE